MDVEDFEIPASIPASASFTVEKAPFVVNLVSNENYEQDCLKDTFDIKYDHVFFVIHGMGRQTGESVNTFGRKVTLLADVTTYLLQSTDNVGTPNILFMPIEWHTSLHELPTVDQQLNKVSLESVPVIRRFCNDVLADSIYYSMPFHQRKILEIVSAQLNKKYTDFTHRHSDFKGKIHMMAHSLGGIIAFDVLCGGRLPEKSQWIDFPVSNLFVFGSPLPATLTMRGLKCGEWFQIRQALSKLGTNQNSVCDGLNFPEHCNIGALDFDENAPEIDQEYIKNLSVNILPNGTRFHNIFNPYDPLAYRCEPFFLNSENVPPNPVTLMDHKSMGLRKSMQTTIAEQYYEKIHPLIPNISMFMLNVSSTLTSFTPFRSDQKGNQQMEAKVAKDATATDLAYAVGGAQLQSGIAESSCDQGHHQGQLLRTPSKSIRKDVTPHRRAYSESFVDFYGDNEDSIQAEDVHRNSTPISRFSSKISQPSDPLAEKDPFPKRVLNDVTAKVNEIWKRKQLDNSETEMKAEPDASTSKQSNSETRLANVFNSYGARRASLGHYISRKIHHPYRPPISAKISSMAGSLKKKFNGMFQPVIGPEETNSLKEDAFSVHNNASNFDSSSQFFDCASILTPSLTGTFVDEENEEELAKKAQDLCFDDLNSSRIDFALQAAPFFGSVMMPSEYLTGMKAHFSYWESKDMMYHVLRSLK